MLKQCLSYSNVPQICTLLKQLIHMEHKQPSRFILLSPLGRFTHFICSCYHCYWDRKWWNTNLGVVIKTKRKIFRYGYPCQNVSKRVTFITMGRFPLTSNCVQGTDPWYYKECSSSAAAEKVSALIQWRIRSFARHSPPLAHSQNILHYVKIT